MPHERDAAYFEYGEIKNERIWIVASKRIPELITVLESMLPKSS
jgi:hypothetical protein